MFLRCCGLCSLSNRNIDIVWGGGGWGTYFEDAPFCRSLQLSGLLIATRARALGHIFQALRRKLHLLWGFDGLLDRLTLILA